MLPGGLLQKGLSGERLEEGTQFQVQGGQGPVQRGRPRSQYQVLQGCRDLDEEFE